MNERISLQIIEGRIVLTSVISAKSLRIPMRLMDFIIDTGSTDSYISSTDIRRLQIPQLSVDGEIDFGGSRFKKFSLPKTKLILLTENNNHKICNLMVSALITTKESEKNIHRSYQLPSILGLNFLKDNRLALYINMNENIAYLE